MTQPIPTVGQATEDIRRIEALLVTLEDDYRMLYDLATTPGTLRTGVESGRTGRRGTSDPTPSMAAGMMSGEKAYVRRRTTQMARKFGQALKRLEEARDIADEVYGRDDPKTAVPRGGAVGSFLEPGQLRESEKAQGRRRRRGEL